MTHRLLLKLLIYNVYSKYGIGGTYNHDNSSFCITWPGWPIFHLHCIRSRWVGVWSATALAPPSCLSCNLHRTKSPSGTRIPSITRSPVRVYVCVYELVCVSVYTCVFACMCACVFVRGYTCASAMASNCCCVTRCCPGNRVLFCT